MAEVAAGLLHHHGDVEASPGMVDYAVNIAGTHPPSWLADALHQTVAETGRYPRASDVEHQVAARYQVAADTVLLTNGASEAFTLVARAQAWRCPVIIHPQFTEPEVALRAAGQRPQHVMLTAEHGFRLAPALSQIPAAADLVCLGNPTNPTSVLHPSDHVHALRQPGRVVLVDEAFMDVVPGRHSVLETAARAGSGLVVVLSWTKTFAIPGVRVGALIGDPALIAACRAQQPHWSVNAFALAAAQALLGVEADAHQRHVARQTQANLTSCVQAWQELGGTVEATPSAPFLLLSHPAIPDLHTALRAHGVAVRRCDTFPGLSRSVVRVAARTPQEWLPLLTAVRALVSSPTLTSGAA